MVFSSKDEIRCSFFSVVVKTSALKMKYNGGLKSFIEQHHARCNRRISVVCAMSEFDLEEVYESIDKAGLKLHEDFECFNAADEVMSHDFRIASEMVKDSEVTFRCTWLKGFVQGSGVMVKYFGENDRMDIDNTEGKVNKSEPVSTSKKPSLSLVARRKRETRKK